MATEPPAAAPGRLAAGAAAAPRAPSAPWRAGLSSSVPAARTPPASGAKPPRPGLRYSTVAASLTLHVAPRLPEAATPDCRSKDERATEPGAAEPANTGWKVPLCSTGARVEMGANSHLTRANEGLTSPVEPLSHPPAGALM